MTQQIKIEPLEPAQGIQAGLEKLFLFNPDALNKIVGDMNDALGDAEQSATDAANSANAAANSATAAAASESAVEQSATAAENAADAAKDSENAAKTSENNAAASATDAASSKAAAAKSAAAAAESAKITQQNEEILQQYVDDAMQYAANAAASSQDAAGFANDAEQYAEEAKQATAGKADKATTLAGYGITDAYTKTQVDQKINDVQGDVDTLNAKVPSNASASNKMATAAEISNLQNQIDENALEIKGLQGAGGALTATNLGSNPTQQSITEYAIDQIWPNNTNFTWNASNPAASTFTDANGIARTAAEIFNGTWVNNTTDNMRWQLTNTQNTTPAVFEWANVGQDIVGIASATTAGIIRVGADSDLVVNQATGDAKLDDTKRYSILDRLTDGLTAEQIGVIQQNLQIASSPLTAVQYGIVPYVLPNKNFMQCDFDPIARPSGSKTALRIVAGTILKMPSGAIFQAGASADLVVEISTIATNMPTAGNKGYVYLVDNGDGTASLAVDNTENAGTRYLIGGFVLMCPLRGSSFVNLPETHPFYSYDDEGGEIMHTSVWHLKNAYDQKMGACAYNPEKRIWVQIYLPSLYNAAGEWQSGSYSTSDSGGTRYTDATLRLQSVYNASPSNNMTFAEQSQWLKMAGCRYIFDDEFTSTAEGSNEETSVTGANQKNAVGGWYDSANRPMISNFGIWEMNGMYWQDIGLSAAGGSAWTGQGLNKGDTYGGQRLLAGALWDSGSHSGSLSRLASYGSSVRARYFAARGASPCFEIV